MKKKLIIAAAVGAVAAAAVPAMALENEFHGMYKFMGFQTNFFTGEGAPALQADSHSGWYAENRARLQYIAKANDNLKLVTHFELDSRFGGISGRYKGTQDGNDGGQLDADSLTLETKNFFLDFNCPLTGTNVKVGLQPWSDSYQSVFALADMTGLYATKKFDPATVSLGWFRFDDNTTANTRGPGQQTADLIVVDAKFAINKDMKVGASYYNVQDDSAATDFRLLHMLGLNGDMTFGPATIKPFVAYQFGEVSTTQDINAFALGAVTKTKVGSGAINATALYLSGDSTPGAGAANGKDKDFKTIGNAVTYFNAANMWLIVPSGQMIGSLSSLVGRDLSVGDRGLLGVFAGYEGTAGKVFYNANLGYAQTDKKQASEKKDIGFEVNAQVGYKLFDNLSVSAAFAYAALGKGLSSTTASERFGGVADADDPYMFNTQLSYTF
jgi:hypothetical protein